MNQSGALQTIDRGLGRWLCKLARPFVRARKPEKIETVLLIELFEMGAAVMLRPSIDYLRSRGADVHVLTTSMSEPIWRELEDDGKLTIHSMRARSPFGFIIEILQTCWKLRRTTFDLVIDYELFFRLPALISAALKARSRAGFYKYMYEGLDRGDFYDQRCAFNQNAHISQNYLALTKTACKQQSDTPNLKAAIHAQEILQRPQIRYTKLKAQNLRPTIIISPDVGTNLSVRNYPLRHMIEVIRQLGSAQIFFVGTKGDEQRLHATADGRNLLAMGTSLLGKTNFGELMQTLAKADLLISNDNGPAHFAVLTGTPTLALFSTDAPTMYGPLGQTVVAYSGFFCSPCISALNHKSTPCRDNKCLQALEPKLVARLAQSILDKKARYLTVNGLHPYVMNIDETEVRPKTRPATA